jgi:tetratricopeptide (TPR) repeat protein
MQDDTISSKRRLLPRWRALARTPSFEVIAGSVRRAQIDTSATMTRHLRRWDQNQTLIEASDVIDAAIISGDYVSAVPAALKVVKDEHAETALKAAAQQVLGNVSDRPTALLNPVDEWDEELLFPTIARLKKRLLLTPRDALTAMEIARLQSQVGQRKSAVRYVERALAAAPNDRYVLRSAANFFAHKGVKEHADLMFRAISSSDAVRVDPWVQAAEIAIANVCNRSPKWAVRARKNLDRVGRPSIQFSELASGIALLELDAGSSRRMIRRFLKISLEAPTENALAQAVWSNKQIGFDLEVSSHLAKIENAYEARARTAYEAQDYKLCINECWEWLQDQHLSPTAAAFGAHVASVVMADYPKAFRFAELGLKANPNNPELLNSKVVALALSGKAREAAGLLPRMALFESDPTLRPFYFAAQGLVAFRLGAFSVGREWYARAVEAAKVSPRPTLAGNATIYWLEQELLAGTINANDAAQITRRLDELYLSKEYGSGKSIVWNARRRIVESLTKSALMKEEVLHKISNSDPAPNSKISNSWVSSLLLH